MSAAQEPPVPPLPLPPEGSACGVGCAVAFVGGTVGLAATNLAAFRDTHPLGLVASGLWLALVAFCLTLAVWQAGVRGAAVACLGPFSRRQFMDARPDGDGGVIGFGYQLFGRRFYYLRLAADDIRAVNMSTGQGTALAGRDMNDWSVAVWYRNPAPSRFVYPGSRDDLVYIVGPPAARAQTAELLAAVVAFLRAAGLDFEPGEDDTEFRRDDE